MDPAGDSLWRSVPLRRLLVRGVLAATSQLVRDVAQPSRRDAVHRMMQERRRLLAELARDVQGEGERRCLDALTAAVAESDRTLDLLLDGETAPTQ